MAKGVSHDEEFKKTIINLLESGKSASNLAREYDLNVKNIYNWKKRYGTITGTDGTVTNNKGLADLKKEIKQLKDENDILKKAMVIFTKK